MTDAERAMAANFGKEFVDNHEDIVIDVFISKAFADSSPVSLCEGMYTAITVWYNTFPIKDTLV